MKKIFTHLIIVFTVIILNGCGGGSNTSTVVTNSTTIINNAITANGGKLTDENMPAIIAVAEQQGNVEYACAGEECLVVKYKNSGYHIWPMADPVDQLPADIPATILRNNRLNRQATLANKNVVIINGCSGLPAYTRRNSYLTAIKNSLTANGYIVKELTPAITTPDELRILNYYSLIIHQGLTGCDLPIPELPYCVTAGKWDDKYCTAVDWNANRIVKVTLPDGSGDYFAVTGKFWEDAYSTTKFNNAFYMNLASCGSHYETYRQSLYKAGVSVYSGWSAPQGKSSVSAWRLLSLMTAGKTLREAISNIPDDYKNDAAAGRETANFWCGPDTKLDITLSNIIVPNAVVTITSPADNFITSDESCTIAGNISKYSAAGVTTISINGKSTALPVTAEGGFSKLVQLPDSQNIVTINHIVNGVDSSATITVNRIMANIALFSQITWNSDFTDIDLHMMPVAGANDSIQECFYGNTDTDWGGQLTKTASTGYGPEIIKATTLLPGKYLLWAEYFNNNNQDTPTTVTAAININGKPLQTINMLAADKFIYADDRWNICEIDMPSGNVTVINEFTSDQIGMKRSIKKRTK